MIFYKFIRFDFKNGLRFNWKKYIVVAILFLTFCLSLFMTIINASYADSSVVLNRPSIGDYLFYFAAGMKEYQFDAHNPFAFPSLWILWLLLALYITLLYPYDDLKGVGKHILIVSGSRSIWWFSKCIWVIISVILFFLIAFLATTVFSLCAGAELSLHISNYMPALVGIDFSVLKQPPWDWVIMLCLIPLVTISLCLLQLVLSLFIKPIFSFLSIAALLLLSAYFQSPFLVGNYAMALRSRIFVTNGMNIWLGFGTALFLIVFSIVTGWVAFSTRDILNGDDI